MPFPTRTYIAMFGLPPEIAKIEAQRQTKVYEPADYLSVTKKKQRNAYLWSAEKTKVAK
jgi:hypothetical protein